MTTDWRIGVYGTSLTGEGRRTSPTAKAKREITAKQEGRCLYCRIKIGTTVRRNDKPVAVRPAWDHFVPFLYSRRNPRDGSETRTTDRSRWCTASFTPSASAPTASRPPTRSRT